MCSLLYRVNAPPPRQTGALSIGQVTGAGVAAKCLVLRARGHPLLLSGDTQHPRGPGPSVQTRVCTHTHTPHGPLAKQGSCCLPLHHPILHRSVLQPCTRAHPSCPGACTLSLPPLAISPQIAAVRPSGAGGSGCRACLSPMELGWVGLQAHRHAAALPGGSNAQNASRWRDDPELPSPNNQPAPNK